MHSQVDNLLTIMILPGEDGTSNMTMFFRSKSGESYCKSMHTMVLKTMEPKVRQFFSKILVPIHFHVIVGYGYEVSH